MRTDPILSVNQIIIYLRKSRSDDPAMSVEDVLANHERQLQEYSERNFGGRIPEAQIFREVVSGETISDRPIMQRVLRLIESDTVRAVLVIEPQRLSRGDLEDCGRIVNLFRYSHTYVLTPMVSYDLMDDYDRKFFEMELTRGNDYLEYTKRILLRGRVASVKQGNFIARIPPYGYRKIVTGDGRDRRHTLEIVPEEAEAIRILFQMYADGSGFQTIAHRLDDLGIRPRHSDHWNPATLKDMLDNPVYIGKVRWNHRPAKKMISDGEICKIRPHSDDCLIVDGLHPAIIDAELYARAHAAGLSRPRVQHAKELRNPFAGLLYCSCGTAMSMKKYASRGSKTGHVSYSMLCNDQNYCHTKSVSYFAVVDRVAAALRETIRDFEVKLQQEHITGAAAAREAEIRALECNLAQLHSRDERQKEAYENGIYTMAEYASRNAKLQEQLQKTAAALDELRISPLPVINYADQIVKFQKCVDSLLDDSISPAEKNRLLKGCIERIDYYNDMPSIPGIGRHVENVFDVKVSFRL